MRLAIRLITAATVLASTVLAAQQPATKPSPDLAGLAHIAIRVHNLDASVAFYEKLGFVRAFALSRDGAVYEAFIKLNDRQFIELYPATPKDPQIGFLHVCFEGADLQAAHDYYVAQGLTPKAVRTAGAGNLLFTMPGPLTPTGPQNMEYTQYMPASMHSKDFGQHLGADRIATKMVQVAIAFEDPASASAFYRDKVSFVPHSKPHSSFPTVFSLPSTPDESIRVETTEQGYKARITLAADPAKAAATLKQRDIPFTRGSIYNRHDLTLTDPDGNFIILSNR